MKEIMGDEDETPQSRYPNASVAWMIFRLLLLVLFAVAALAISVKLAWLLIQTLFGV